MIRHVVRASDPRAIEQLVLEVADADALRDGRVFIGKVRARGSETLALGDVVIVQPRRAHVEIEILARRNGFVAVNKPAGIPTIPDQEGASHSLLALAVEKTGNRGLHATSRLDRGVSGIVVFAENAEANELQLAARRDGQYERRYFAIACGAPQPAWGEWSAPIGRAKDPKLRKAFGTDAKPATTRYFSMGEGAKHTILLALPETGRTHQIRVHASHAGLPLLGDRDYGGATRIVDARGKVTAITRVALHCARVAFPPLGEVIAPLPLDLLALVDIFIQFGAGKSP